MRSDPRIGYYASLGVAGLSALWLLMQAIAGDEIFELIGYSTHAITFLSIFLLVCGLLVSLLFRSYAGARSDLVAGRGVIARWRVTKGTWLSFSGPAEGLQREEKLSILYVMYAFIVVICGALALLIPDDAMIFGWIALGIAALVTVAFLVGTRIDRSHLEYTSGEVIIGRRGLMVNGVLHVWDVFLSWLEGAAITERPVPMLTVSYVIWTRAGPQDINVRLPVETDQMALARSAEEQLNALAGQEPRRRSRQAKVKNATGQTTG